MKNAILFFFAFFINSLLILINPASPAMSAERKGSQGVANATTFIETTERSYLFVCPAEDNDNINTGNRRRTAVTSRCQKPAGAGPEAKKCTHEIEIQPGNTRFKLNSGEDIVMIDLPGENDPFILGSVIYGYNNAPDVIMLYDEKGKYLGKTKGINMVNRPDEAKIIAEYFYLRNAIENDGKYYIIIIKEDNEKEHEALVLKKDAESRRVPFSIAIPDKEKCSEWYIEEFVKNGDGLTDLAIKLKGVSCSSKEGAIEKYLKCSMAQ